MLITLAAAVSVLLGALPYRAATSDIDNKLHNPLPEIEIYADRPPEQERFVQPLTPAQVEAMAQQIASLVPEPGMSAPLLTGLIAHESRFDAGATAFEKKAYPRIRERERSVARARELSTSYGLAQVMGDTARDWGISVGELQEDPELQVHLGALQLGRCLRREHGDRFWALACYNAGLRKSRSEYPQAAKVYAAKVLKEAIRLVEGEEAKS